MKILSLFDGKTFILDKKIRMTLNEYLEKFAEIHDKMRNTVDPKEIEELTTEHINLMEKILREHYGYVRPQERD